MAQVLTVGAKVVCPHAGQLQLKGESKLRINGQEVVTKLQGLLMDTNCTNKTSPATPCTSCLTDTAVRATKLSISGSSVCVVDASGIVGVTDGTTGTPPPAFPLKTIEPQIKLVAS